MMLQDYSNMEYNMKNDEKLAGVTLLPSLMLLLEEAKSLLFPDGKYKRLKWHQFGRIWKLAKFAIKFINTLMAIFGKK